jgi:hypothetical protein
MTDILKSLLERAGHDPRILHLDRRQLGHLLVFGHSPEDVSFERRQFETTGRLSESVAALEVNARGIHGNQEHGADRSVARMREFVKWVLDTFAPCRVYDDETKEDITSLVSKDPCFLFK